MFNRHRHHHHHQLVLVLLIHLFFHFSFFFSTSLFFDTIATVITINGNYLEDNFQRAQLHFYRTECIDYRPANIMLNIRILRSRGEGIWYQTKAIEKGGMYIIGIFLFQWDGDGPLCYFANGSPPLRWNVIFCGFRTRYTPNEGKKK